MPAWETVAPTKLSGVPNWNSSEPTSPSGGGWETVVAEPPKPGFFGAAAKTLVEAGKAGVAHPAQIIPGAAEALAGSVGALAETAAGGVAGLGGGALSWARGKPFMEGFEQAKGAVEEGFSKIPLAPETEVGKKLGDVLALIPGGIHAVGETVFEKTGSALAAAGTEGLATLLTLKPGLATKSLGWAFEKGAKGAPSEAVKGAFDDLIKTDPAKAEALANHVDDKALKKELDKRISEITVSSKKQVADIFKRAKGETPSTVGEVKQIFEQAKQAGLQRAEATPEGNLQATVAAAHSAQEQAVVEPITVDRRVLERATPTDRRQDLAGRVDKSLQLAEEAKVRAKAVGAELKAAHDAGAPTKELTQKWKAAREEVGKHELDAKKLRDALEQGRVAAAKATSGATTVFMHAGIPVTKADLSKAFTLTRGVLKKSPVYNTVESEVRTSVDQLIRNLVPEMLGPQAKLAAATVAKNMAERMHEDSAHYNRSLPRREYWNNLGPERSERFIDQFERGKRFDDPVMQKAAEGYKQWNDTIYQRDQALGLKYTPEENYLYHTFLNSQGAAEFFFKRYGPKWNDPKFIKERGFEMYSQARANGFQPRFTNPEDIMLARQHASDVARMQVQALRELREYGLASLVHKGETAEPGFTQWRAPNGERYWVHNNAAQILHNAFNTKSLWNMQGAVGATFRGAMWLKNIVVPIKLALSAFHPLHVATIDNATSMVRASKGLLSESVSPTQWLKQMAEGVTYKELGAETKHALAGGVFNREPTGGYRLLNVWKGKIPESKLTDADRTALQYMTEGGMIPEMAAQYKNRSIEAFRDSVQQHSASALYHLPFAIIQSMQKPIFEVWIPSLKAASYLRDVQAALRADPSLIADTPKRLETFRRLGKSVENRYGEMAYNTLFWNRWIKDLGVASTLSLGWNLGFLREYGGAIGDVAKAAGAPLRESAKRGTLDRPMFVAFYTTQALAYGGLLTWALTGTPPSQLLDYIFPRSGEKRPDGSPARVNTMFYTREFASIYKHMQNEGIVSGLGRLAANKASPLLDEANTFLTNVNYLGQEISDPNAPAFKQLEQKIAYTLKDAMPITVQAVQKSKGTAKDYALSFAGFTPAPVYVTETPVEGKIKNLYHQYHKDITPFEKLEYGRDAAKLREAYNRRDAEEYAKILVKMREEHNLTGKQLAQLKRNVKVDPTVRMFSQLGASQQKQLLGQMSQQERLKYLRHAKEGVRRDYRRGLE